MTVETYSSLPFSAGGALASAAYRSALGGVAVFMRQPLRNSALAGLIGLCVLAGGNALYRQHHHPAPLFGSFEAPDTPPGPARATRDSRPVMPVERPTKLAVDTSETTGTIAPQPAIPAPTVIGHDDVVALQKKLIALNFFNGTADGLFGAKTAAAIKAFEQSVGRPPKGMLTPQIIAAIAAAPLPQPVPPTPAPALPAKLAPAPAAAAAPVAAPLAAAATTVKPLIPLAALPAPSPLAAAPKSDAASSTAPVAAASSAVVPPLPQSIASSAPSSDASVQQDAEISPSQTDALPLITKRSVQTIAVHAAPAQPLPAALAPPEDSDQATTDPDTVASVQRGLNSLGFLRGNITGIADEATAKAVRNFEVFYNYDVTGRVTKELVNLLKMNGATV